MIVIADTSPIQYLHLVGRLEVLRALFGVVHVPSDVLQELTDPATPEVVRDLALRPPEWMLVHRERWEEPSAVQGLGLGERAAISLACREPASLLLVDDSDARRIALRLGVRVTGTIGIVQRAHERGLLDARTTILALQSTNMRIPAEFRVE